MKGWHAKILSIPGRNTLVKSVVMSMPEDKMSSYVILKPKLKKIDAILRNLWRGLYKAKIKGYSKAGQIYPSPKC